MSKAHSYKIRVDAPDEAHAIEIAGEGLFAGSEIIESSATRIDSETFEVTLRYRPPQAKLSQN